MIAHFGTATVIDVRDPVGAARRINVSRRSHANDHLHLRALGNPYRPRTPGDTLPRYRQLIGQPHDERHAALQHIVGLLANGVDVELACWCHGASTCHATVIRDVVDAIVDRELQIHTQLEQLASFGATFDRRLPGRVLVHADEMTWIVPNDELQQFIDADDLSPWHTPERSFHDCQLCCRTHDTELGCP